MINNKTENWLCYYRAEEYFYSVSCERLGMALLVVSFSTDLRGENLYKVFHAPLDFFNVQTTG